MDFSFKIFEFVFIIIICCKIVMIEEIYNADILTHYEIQKCKFISFSNFNWEIIKCTIQTKLL